MHENTVTAWHLSNANYLCIAQYDTFLEGFQVIVYKYSFIWKAFGLGVGR